MLLFDLALLVIIFLIGFVVITAAYFIRFDVPAVPSPSAIARAMVEAAEMKGTETVMDLGAGDGRILIEAKRRFPGITAIGYELVPTIWWLGSLRVWWSGQHIDWRCADAMDADVRQANIIFLYVTPEMMQRLEEKFDRELRMGTKVVSHVFTFKNHIPIAKVPVPWKGGEKMVRVYEW